MLRKIPSEVRHLFAAAGWRPARRVSVDDRVPEHHPAHDVLQKMGGLHVGQAGYGIECASSDLLFQFCDEAPEILSTWSELLGCKLIGVAEVHRSHGLLLMDEAERWFSASLIHDAFYFEDHNFGEALTRLLLGRKSRPMLRPDQHQVDLYGDTFVRVTRRSLTMLTNGLADEPSHATLSQNHPKAMTHTNQEKKVLALVRDRN